MKKLVILLGVFCVLFCSAVRAEVESFLSEDEIPAGAEFLPLPPTPTDAAFYNDWRRYQWGKTMRETERGKLAVEDAVHTVEYFSKIYSEPLGITISPDNTPEITALLTRLLETTYLCNKKSKSVVMRTRPFIQFNEPTPVPEDEEKLRKNSSYPSGHTSMGWAIALVLAEINPDNQNAILKRGYEYGESRVIVGFHYQSDVDAARIITSALVNRLHTNPEFLEQLAIAKQEYVEKSQKN